VREFFQELTRASVYKRGQGRPARDITFAALAVILALGCWRLNQTLGASEAIGLGLPSVLLAAGLWISFRLVNMPSFADFLVSVQAEMNKVSWPSRTELYRSSLVVIFTIFFLAGILFLYDLIWQQLFTFVNVLE
jgi:preprotein translocase subunit SecE